MIGAALRATPAVSPAAAAAAASKSHCNGRRLPLPAALSRTDAAAGLIASCGSAGPTIPSNARGCRSATGSGEGAAAVARRGWAEAWALGAFGPASRIAVGRTASGRAATGRAAGVPLRAGTGHAARARASGAWSEAVETRGVSLRRDDSAATGLAGTAFDRAAPAWTTSVANVEKTCSGSAGGAGSATAGSADAGSGSGAATTSGSGAMTGRRAGSSDTGST